MVKKVFSIISFALSAIIFIIMSIFAFEAIRTFIYIKSASSGGKLDGFIFAAYMICIAAASLIGIIFSALSLKLSVHKALKITSYILLIVFFVTLLICAFIIG